MKVLQVTEVGVSGMREKVLGPVVDAVAKRTPVRAQTLRGLLGALFVLTALRTVYRASRAAVRQARA